MSTRMLWISGTILALIIAYVVYGMIMVKPPGGGGSPPPQTCVPTAGVPPAVPVSGVTVTTDVSGGPVSVAFFSTFGQHEITIANSGSEAVAIAQVTLWESIDNSLKRKADLPAGCTGYMGISETTCIPPGGSGSLAPGGSCVIKLTVTKYQTGKVDVETGIGTLTIPISVTP